MLNVAPDILRQYVRALDAAPDYADPGVHESFLPRIREAIRAVESYLAENPSLSRTEAALLQADLAMLRDVEDQSSKHLGSLVARVKQYLSERPAAAGGAVETAPPAPVRNSTNGGMLWAAAAILAIFILGKK
jgi:hypothetical protein